MHSRLSTVLPRLLLGALLVTLTGCPDDPPEPTAPEPVLGFAELHAHPASHLAFGSRDDGSQGLFHGYPGLGLAEGERDLTTHLAQCDGWAHSGFDLGNPIREEVRGAVVTQAGAMTGHPHARSGGGTYEAWPHSQSLVHQQMHITQIRRAYLGGLRLMVASVTDNQLIAEALWHNNLSANSQHEYDSAVRQLKFIHEQADANADWMAIVKTPEEARAAIHDNKLAIVLAVEMDSLDGQQLQTLYDDYGVRVVTPIHLADSHAFGGAAVYGDLFNVNSKYLTGAYFSVEADPNLTSKLGRVSVPYQHPYFVEPLPVPIAEDCEFGYRPCPETPGLSSIPWHHGVKNKKGLHTLGISRLMRKGMIIDISHMSERSVDQMLVYADKRDFPLIASHGGIRPDGAIAGSERSLKRSQAQILAQKGGVIGFGTEGQLEPQRLSLPPVEHRFNDNGAHFAMSLEQFRIEKLEVQVHTGPNSDPAGGRVWVGIEREGQPWQESAFPEGSPAGGEELWTTIMTLSPPIAESELLSIRLRLEGEGYHPLTHVRVVATSPRGTQRIVHEVSEHEVPGGMLLSAETPELLWPLRFATGTLVNRLFVEVTTGDNEKDAGDDVTGTVFIKTGTGGLPMGVDLNLAPGETWATGRTTRSFTLPAGTAIQDLSHFELRYVTEGGPWEVAARSEWDVKGVAFSVERPDGVRVPLREAEGLRHDWKAKWDDNVRHFRLGAIPHVHEDEEVAGLRIAFKVSDEMNDDDKVIPFRIHLRSGGIVDGKLNHGGELRDKGQTVVLVPMRGGLRASELERLEIDRNGVDEWAFSSLTVDVLKDPVPLWTKEYLSATQDMGGRGVALGTDLNGMAPQIPFTNLELPEKIDVVEGFARDNLAGSEALGESVLGSTTFRFGERGLAHFGMLPDFLQAVGLASGGDRALEALYNSAEDFLQMWEGVQVSAGNADAWPVERVTAARVTVKTANDDLRCDSRVKVTVELEGGSRHGAELPSPMTDRSTHAVEFELGGTVPVTALKALHVDAELGEGGYVGCLTPGIPYEADQWKIESVRLEVKMESGHWEQLSFQSRHPLKHFTRASASWSEVLH
ncbi:MAG TPA: membrane dipeptidase [Myxococcaceae bacterium]|nr:membrane dipeptidase [Myxococcaceae bacterium]